MILSSVGDNKHSFFASATGRPDRDFCIDDVVEELVGGEGKGLDDGSENSIDGMVDMQSSDQDIQCLHFLARIRKGSVGALVK